MRGFLYPLFLFLKFKFSLRRAQAARGPLLSAPAESRQRQAQGSFTPLRIPGPKWGAGRPPLETPKSRCAIRIGRTPRRFAAGASVPLGKAASACALATAAAPPPLRLGAAPPCPLPFPLGNVCRSCAPAHGTASETAFAATPSQISRKLLPRKRLGVPSNPDFIASFGARLWPQATLARPQGESQRGRSPLWPVFAYFLLARK